MMSKLKDLMQHGKMRNIALIAIALVIVVSLIGLFFFRSDTASESSGAKIAKIPARISSSPASQKFSEEYLKVLLKGTEQEVKQAKKTGGSAIPTLLKNQQAKTTGEAFTAEALSPTLQKCVKDCRENLAETSSSALLNQLTSEGKISAVVAAQLNTLHDQNTSVDDYAAELNQLVREGKLTPEQAKKLLETYRKERGQSSTCLSSQDVINQMLSEGKMLPGVTFQIRQLSQQSMNITAYKAALDHLSAEGNITPGQSTLLADAYRRDQTGECEQQAASQPATTATTATGGRQSAGSTTQLEQLTEAQRVQRAQTRRAALTKEQRASQTKQMAAAEATKNKQLKDLQNSMNSQSQALFTSWNPVKQSFVEGKTQQGATTGQQAGTASAGAGSASGTTAAGNIPLIKAGTILFAVLDTGVDSDQPGPVMSTIVSGKFKGARLMGSLEQTPDGERVMLKFNLITMENWATSLKIDAVAINPDDARTALASSVDHHYLLRYGSLFASSFLSGYAEGLKSSGSTSTESNILSDLGVKEETYQELTPKQLIMVGLGKVGEELSSVTKETFNRKPTVKVDAGVGLGILFSTDVTEAMPEKLPPNATK